MINNVIAEAIPSVAASPITNPVLNPTEGSLSDVATNPLGFFIARLWWTIVILGGLTMIIFVVWGGMDLLMSEGNKERYEGATKKITHAVMGMALLAASYVIIKLVSAVFGIDLLKPNWPGLNP